MSNDILNISCVCLREREAERRDCTNRVGRVGKGQWEGGMCNNREIEIDHPKSLAGRFVKLKNQSLSSAFVIQTSFSNQLLASPIQFTPDHDTIRYNTMQCNSHFSHSALDRGTRTESERKKEGLQRGTGSSNRWLVLERGLLS